MTAKKYYLYRIIIAALLAAIFSASIVAKNIVIPVVAVISGMLLIIMMKKNVKEVMIDERDYEIAGRSARYAINVFSILATIIMFFLIIYRESNPGFETAATLLAYSVCSLMIFYSIIFKYLQQDTTEKRKKFFWMLFLVFFGIAVIIFNLRFFSGEDDWICQNGSWTMHGHPSAPMPSKPCVK